MIGPCGPSLIHISSGSVASNRPNAVGGVPSGRVRSSKRAKWRCRVRGEGAHRCSSSMIRAMWAAVRAGRSRLSRAASSSTSASVRAAGRCSAGVSASTPPARNALIQRSRLARDTVTGSPNGPRCTWAASSRTPRPRSAGDRPGSANGRISEYRYSAISRARSARDFFLGFDIDSTSTLPVIDSNDAVDPDAPRSSITDAGSC